MDTKVIEKIDIDYDQVIDEITSIMVKYGATHHDARKIMYKFLDTIELQKLRYEK